MEKSHLFMDPFYVINKMGPKLGAAKTSGLNLYERVVHTPSKAVVDSIIQLYDTEYVE